MQRGNITSAPPGMRAVHSTERSASARSRVTRYLSVVAEEGQLTRAARRLAVSQPALSQSIAALESELGVRLLERGPRGVALTRSGQAFLARGRDALAAEADLARTAEALSRAARGSLSVGFIGPPPMVSAPELFEPFAEHHPHATIAFRDATFPTGATREWLGGVDAAFCHAPAAEPGVGICTVCAEPRAVLAGSGHALAGREELSVADVLEETFVGYHATVQPAWAAFHTLDDHRGGPPRLLTADGAQTTLHMLGIMSSSRAITVVPRRDAMLAHAVLPTLVAIPLRDAAPAAMSLVWRRDSDNPLLHALVAFATELELRS